MHDYRYGLGFWLIIGVSLLNFGLAVGKLFVRGRKSPYWGGKVLPLLFFLGLLAYAAAYVGRVPLAWESDVTVCACVISVLFLKRRCTRGSFR